MNNLTSLRLGAPTSVEGTLGGLYEMGVQSASRLRSLTLKDGEQSRDEYEVSGVRVGIEDMMRDIVISERCAFDLSVSGVRSTSARAAAIPLEFSTVTATKVGGDGSVTQEGNHVTVEGYAVVRIRATHYGHEVYLRDLHCCVMAHEAIAPLCETYAPLQQVLVERNELVPLLAEYPDLVHSLVDTGTQQYVHQDGGSTAGYILTDLYATADMEVYADLRVMRGSTSGVLYAVGVNDADPYDMWIRFDNNGGNPRGYFKLGRTETNATNAAWNNARSLFMVSPQKWGVVGSETERVANVSGMDGEGALKVAMFGRATSSADRNTTANNKLDIFSLVVKQSGVTHLLVPFVRDGQTGFLDLYTLRFFGNSHTSGEFSIGSDTADYGDHYRAALAATATDSGRVTSIAPVGALTAAARLLGQRIAEAEATETEGWTVDTLDTDFVLHGGTRQLRCLDENGQEVRCAWSLDEIKETSGTPTLTPQGVLTIGEGEYAVLKVSARAWSDMTKMAKASVQGGLTSNAGLGDVLEEYPALSEMIIERPALMGVVAEYPSVVNSLIDTGKRNWLTFDANCYFDTGVKPFNEIRVEACFHALGATHFMGTRISASSHVGSLNFVYAEANKNYRIDLPGGQTHTGVGSVVAEVSITRTSISINGKNITVKDTKYGNTLFPMFIGGSNQNGTVSYGEGASSRFSRLAIFDNTSNELLHEFVPVADNVVVDLVTLETLEKQGSGNAVFAVEDK